MSSHDVPLFTDRRDAGDRLALALDRYRGQHPLVLGIPRGGVPIGAAVQERLGGELDVLVARKLGAPRQHELALGAVTARGGLFLNRQLLREIELPRDYLVRAITVETAEAEAAERRFRRGAPPLTIYRRLVILVDDGLATGATMRAAVRTVRGESPARLVVGVPVASARAVAMLADEVDDVVAVAIPSPFSAVGRHYLDFDACSDAEVVDILKRLRPSIDLQEETY